MENSDQNKENDKPKEDENSKFICNLLKGAVGVFIVVILLFVGINICGGDFFNKENPTLSNLGTIGDYFGGLINPLLGFVSFCALLYTIQIQMKSLAKQSEELELTREELKATKEELARSAKAQEQSSAIFKQQQFETTFFSLINQLNSEIDKFSDSELKDNSINNSLERFIRTFFDNFGDELDSLSDSCIDDVIAFLKLMPNDSTQKIYALSNGIFKGKGLLLILLRLLETSDIGNKDFYLNIIRSSLSRQMLYAIAIIGCADDDLKNFIEKYHLLEFMPFRLSPKENPHSCLRFIAMQYQHCAFGESVYLQDLMQFEQWLRTKNQHIVQNRETSDAN